MITGDKGLELIKYFEGLRLEAYRCPADVWTIGYGHTRGVQPGDTVTADLAEAYLCKDLAESEHAVNMLVTVPLNQNQFDALVSFTFNLGASNLHASTLLKKLNAEDYQGAGGEFLCWVHGGGKTLPGLVARREAEKTLFLSKS